ncbi:MAG: Ca2+-binding RTX toxin-like protein [Ascidiaceihabitans sp.]|jgi:Ca2+-binding RTX toxin-like protein
MAGIVLLSLLGWGLVYTLVFDDDDDTSSAAREDGSGETEATDPSTDGSDILEGDAGDNRIFGNGGDDLITGGAGDDELFGGAGTDIVLGQDGDDFARGGTGDDLLTGGEGEDTLRGDAGDDLILSADLLDEVAYLASIENAQNIDDIDVNFTFDTDEDEADTVFGGSGDDLILFGSNDVVSGGNGEDILTGGDWMEPGDAAIITDYERGTDVLVYSYAANTPEPVVSFTEVADGDDAEVRINGEVAMVLQGIDFSTLTLADVMLAQRPT